MKERPILFSAPMVNAILNGSKSQTRRVINPQPPTNGLGPYLDEDGDWVCFGWGGSCPYGKVGDQLWVRETWAAYRRTSYEYNEWELVEDKAQLELYGKELSAVYKADNKNFPDRWKPSIFMPRWASRIQLEITGVRVERLQNISRGDCMAEGCPFPNIAKETDPVKWYMDLWESINSAGSWAENPWVWVIEFKVINS